MIESNLVKSAAFFNLDSLYSLLDSGGPVVAILLVLSVFCSAIIIFKIWQFLYLGVGRHKRSEQAIDMWLDGQSASALKHLEKHRSPIHLLLLHAMRGLISCPGDEALVREDLERIASRQINSLRSYLRGIEATAQVAPLLGLFGTVLGMIGSFRALQAAGAEADPSVLAGGISVALLTTAVGIAIAVPATLALYWFEGAVEREQQAMETALTSVLTGRLTDAERCNTHAAHRHSQSLGPVPHAA